tara:strand:- start:2544 stop:3260 length:717 start_codon:yes stop_codon:yes gene_type:complete
VSAPAPLRQGWKDIRDTVQGWILSRRFGPGDKLPRDADIAAELGCARSTVQRAMQDLADSGLIERRRKGGTHVRPDPVARAVLDIPVTRVEVESAGMRHGYRLIARALTAPPPAIATAMRVPPGQELLWVKALHLADGRPYILEDRWICPQTAPGILSVDLNRLSANEWLVHTLPFTRFDLRLRAQSARADEAALLGAAPGEALLVIERVTWQQDRAITLVTALAAPGYQLVTGSAAP